MGYRNSADAEDKSPLVAKPGQRVRAVRASERWVLAQNGLWLPRQFLGAVGGEDGLELPLRATYRRVMAHNEVSLPCHRHTTAAASRTTTTTPEPDNAPCAWVGAGLVSERGCVCRAGCLRTRWCHRSCWTRARAATAARHASPRTTPCPPSATHPAPTQPHPLPALTHARYGVQVHIALNFLARSIRD